MLNSVSLGKGTADGLADQGSSNGLPPLRLFDLFQHWNFSIILRISLHLPSFSEAAYLLTNTLYPSPAPLRSLISRRTQEEHLVRVHDTSLKTSAIKGLLQVHLQLAQY